MTADQLLSLKNIDKILHLISTNRSNRKEYNIHIQDICLSYLYDGDEIDIAEIYNQDTGETYWRDNGAPWSSVDEIIIDSLLMWGEIE